MSFSAAVHPIVDPEGTVAKSSHEAAGAGVDTEATVVTKSLHEAVRVGDAATVEQVLGKGSEADEEGRPFVDQPDKDGWTPLLYAAANGHAQCMVLLLDKAAAVD